MIFPIKEGLFDLFKSKKEHNISEAEAIKICKTSFNNTMKTHSWFKKGPFAKHFKTANGNYDGKKYYAIGEISNKDIEKYENDKSYKIQDAENGFNNCAFELNNLAEVALRKADSSYKLEYAYDKSYKDGLRYYFTIE